MKNFYSNQDNNPLRNPSGYIDYTAHDAIEHADAERERKKRERNHAHHKVIETIFTICELAGFEVEGRIVLKDKKTGKVYR